MLMKEENDIRRSVEPRINLEYAVVRMAYLEPRIPVEEIVSRMEGLETRLAGSTREDISPKQQKKRISRWMLAQRSRSMLIMGRR